MTTANLQRTIARTDAAIARANALYRLAGELSATAYALVADSHETLHRIMLTCDKISARRLKTSIRLPPLRVLPETEARGSKNPPAPSEGLVTG